MCEQNKSDKRVTVAVWSAGSPPRAFCGWMNKIIYRSKLSQTGKRLKSPTEKTPTNTKLITTRKIAGRWTRTAVKQKKTKQNHESTVKFIYS